MKHFIDNNTNQLWAFESDGSQDPFITESMQPLSDEEADAHRAAIAAAALVANYDYRALRAAAFKNEADPLFFKAQRGEATNDQWLAKCDEIRSRYPVEYTLNN